MIGQPLARFEDERLLTGKGCFADDLRRRRRSRYRGGDECDLRCARRGRGGDAGDAGKALGDPAQQGIIEKEEGKTMSTMMTPAYNPMLPLAGRLLIATIFLVAGIRKVLGFAGTVGYFTKLGFPAGEAFAVIAIII